mgnify:CR=1 FL=1
MNTINTPYGTMKYETIEEFVDNFPFAERQCLIQVQRELTKNGFYRFSDFDCSHIFVLVWTDDTI